MAAATLFSRILGMVREVVYSWFMGVSWVAGAFLIWRSRFPTCSGGLLGQKAR